MTLHASICGHAAGFTYDDSAGCGDDGLADDAAVAANTHSERNNNNADWGRCPPCCQERRLVESVHKAQPYPQCWCLQQHARRRNTHKGAHTNSQHIGARHLTPTIMHRMLHVSGCRRTISPSHPVTEENMFEVKASYSNWLPEHPVNTLVFGGAMTPIGRRVAL